MAPRFREPDSSGLLCRNLPGAAAAQGLRQGAPVPAKRGALQASAAPCVRVRVAVVTLIKIADAPANTGAGGGLICANSYAVHGPKRIEVGCRGPSLATRRPWELPRQHLVRQLQGVQRPLQERRTGNVLLPARYTPARHVRQAGHNGGTCAEKCVILWGQPTLPAPPLTLSAPPASNKDPHFGPRPAGLRDPI